MGKDRTLEIIKTEIERLKSIEYPCDNSQQATGFFNALDIMTDFLSTLESEKPVPNDLEEAAEEYEKNHTYQRYDGGGLTPEYNATLAESFIAGAKWQAEQDDKELSEKIASAYQLGLVDKEKQMMKEAIGGNAYPNAGEIWIDLARYGYKFKEGEPCRIIIIKEDEK